MWGASVNLIFYTCYTPKTCPKHELQKIKKSLFGVHVFCTFWTRNTHKNELYAPHTRITSQNHILGKRSVGLVVTTCIIPLFSTRSTPSWYDKERHTFSRSPVTVNLHYREIYLLYVFSNLLVDISSLLPLVLCISYSTLHYYSKPIIP